MNKKEWVEEQKSEWRPKSEKLVDDVAKSFTKYQKITSVKKEKIDYGNKGMEEYMRE